MKDFLFCKTVNDYREMVKFELLKTEEFRSNPFYLGLRNWITDHRTPIYFRKSHDEEHFHFSPYYGAHLIRDYDSDAINDGYYAHDWVHRLFYYPAHPRRMPYTVFRDLCIANENYASTETEILMYALRGIERDSTFQFKILYDLLVEVGYSKWGVHDVALLRKALATSDGVWELLATRVGSEKIKQYMAHSYSNELWCAIWYEHVPQTYSLPFWHRQRDFLNYDNYADVVLNYGISTLTQRQYELQMTSTVGHLYSLVTGKDSYHTFAEVPDMLAEMEGKVAVPDAARIYHEISARHYTRY